MSRNADDETTGALTHRRTDAPTHRATKSLNHQSTFVGLGFGPIQGGLFLYEAARGGCFNRLVASEIVPETVAAVRSAGGYSVNVAHSDRVEAVAISPIEILNPTLAKERHELIAALAVASEVATALPSVALYEGDESSPARLLATAIELRGEQGAPLLVYTGENTVNAAHLLAAAIRSHLPADCADSLMANVAIVDTVIGKMSGYASVGAGEDVLAPVAPGLDRAFLVEAFSRILVTRPNFDNRVPIQRGIAAFVEVEDLLPFEEFKLYCHNGMHAIAAYLGKIAGCTSMAQLVHVPGLLPLVRAAVVEEAGAALVDRYCAWSPEFSAESVASKVDDLIERMVNPFLDDAISRVARDPARKLGWEDRLIGAMNLALEGGIAPHRYALGAAAALADLVGEDTHQTGAFPWGRLPALWGNVDGARASYLEHLIAGAWQHLEAFRDASSATPMAPAAGAQVVQSTHAASRSKLANGGSVDGDLAPLDVQSHGVADGHPIANGKPAPDRTRQGSTSYYDADM